MSADIVQPGTGDAIDRIVAVALGPGRRSEMRDGNRGVAPMDNVSAGEVGGVLAGVLAVAYAIGRAIGWTVDRIAKRIDDRAAENEQERNRLTEWRASLDRREQEAREQTEGRLAAIEETVRRFRRQQGVMHQALREVTRELFQHAPHSAAAMRAEQLLAFPIEDIPEDMAELARRFDEEGERQ